MWSVLLVAALIQDPPPVPVPPPPNAAIERATIEAHVRALASDALGGRNTGSPEAVVAAKYLATVLEHAGVQPAGDGDTYLQRVPMFSTEYTAIPTLAVARADAVETNAICGVDFEITAGSGGERTLTVLTVHSAKDIPSPARADHALYVAGNSRDRRDWLKAAGVPDGEGWGLVITQGAATAGKGALDAPPRKKSEAPPTPRIAVRGPLRDSFDRGEIAKVRFNAPGRSGEIASYNVIGRIAGHGKPGAPELAHQTIVFSAHYDHLGHSSAAKPAPEAAETTGAAAVVDTVFNGADDDASGCAAVLELAEAFAKEPPPARTLIFFFATGEEIGLIGTDYYLEHPAEPLTNTVTNLNFEMIGRPDPLVGGAGHLWLTGFERSNLGPAFQTLGLPLDPDKRPEQNFFMRSDNFAFARLGIVAQTLSSYNMHDDYHHVSDEADKLDYAHMEACVRASFTGARALADGSLTPAWTPDGDPSKKR